MKYFHYRSFVVLAAFCLSISACTDQNNSAGEKSPQRAKIENLQTTPDDIKKEAADLAKTTLTYTEEQKALYHEKIMEQVAQYNQRLGELEAKLAMMNEQARAELAAEIDELKRKKTKISAKLSKLQEASGKAYEDLKNGMEQAMAEMDKAYEQAMNRFKK